MKRMNQTLIAIAVASAFALPAVAEPGVSVEATGIYLDAGAHGGGVLKVTGPNNFRYEQKVAAGQSTFLDLNVLKGLGLEDGGYNYEMIVSPALSETQKAIMADLRELGDTAAVEDMRKEGLMPAPMAPMSGYFTVDQGQIADPNLVEYVAPRNDAKTATKDQVILDDLIVDGSACVGFDCVNGESFGFDTIRMKENNIRLHAQDTSTSASFPSTDWRLIFNETSNGGANKFSIEDASGARTPFTIEANAPNNSLYVDDGGRIGLGTSTPVSDIHVKSGNTPTLRLEQDGSSGFAAQIWDLAGNEANFFIRDATSGSTLPFRVFPGAPSNSLTIEGTTGDIGIGTTSPNDTDGFAERIVEISDTSDVRLVLDSGEGAGRFGEVQFNRNNAQAWSFGNDNNQFYIYNYGRAENAFTINRTSGAVNVTGDLTISGQCVEVDGACAPDYVFEPDYELRSLSELESFLDSNGHLPNVPSAEEIHTQGINMRDFNFALLEKIEELTLYTLQQEKAIAALTERLNEVESD